MPATSHFQFALALLLESERSGPMLAEVTPVRPCWSAALESARWNVVEQAEGLNVTIDFSGEHIEPIWQEAAGEPYVAALRATSASECGIRSAVELPLSYFDEVASAASEQVRSGDGSATCDSLRYVVLATRVQKTKPAAEDGLKIEESAVVHRLLPGDFCALRQQSRSYDAPCDDELPAFVPEHVLHEMTAIALDAATVETGGILLGHLCRDLRNRQVFVEVSAQVPARHACSESTRLTFTPETWAAADAVRGARGGDERFVGWWHSHPAASWAQSGGQDDPTGADSCDVCLTGEFFSSLDCALHRACFPGAFSLALVVSDSRATGVTTPMFGWRRGTIARRGYYIIDSRSSE